MKLNIKLGMQRIHYMIRDGVSEEFGTNYFPREKVEELTKKFNKGSRYGFQAFFNQKSFSL